MTPKSSIADIMQLIGDAKNAELCRDINNLRHILQSVWNDYDHLPSFDEFQPLTRAELFRLCGFFMTFYGRSLNKIEYQSKAKDLLINSIEIFDTENSLIGAAESRISLAFCYWNSGEISEANSIIETVESEFQSTSHPVYLQAQINRILFLVWELKLDEARKLSEKISTKVQLCDDLRLKSMFHSESAIIYRRLKEYDLAESNYREAIRLSSKAKNTRFIAVNFNNLAYFYRDHEEYNLAHLYANKALKIYNDLGDEGWIPHVLDTIALIFLDEKKYSKALKTIDSAIEYFYKGEDTTGLLDALWTKTRCFLSLDELEEAVVIFGELQFVALSRIGDVALRKYSKLLVKEIYALKKLSLPEEVSNFKKTLVSAALIEANGEIGKAAKILKLKKHQALSDILEKQFPELRGELGFTRRARRTVKIINEKPKEETKTVIIQQKDIRRTAEIKKIILPDKKYSFEFPFRSPTFEVYYFKKSQMKLFGKESGAVIAVSPIEELKAGMLVLAADGDKFLIGKTEYDDFAELYFIPDASGFPVPLDKENLVGEPVGFCPAEKTKDDFINFEKLQII